jgi:hypothetical protein
VEHATRARQSPDIYVIDPKQLTPAKDPDELLRRRGRQAWHELIATRACGITWRANALANATSESPERERRSALARAGRWLGTLPPRLALEQEDALRSVADRCGYSSAAVERSFRARYWNTHERSRGIAPTLER